MKGLDNMDKVILEGSLGFWFSSKEKLALYDNNGTISILNNLILSEAYKNNWLFEDKKVKITIEEV